MALTEERRETLRRYNSKPERKAYVKAWYEANKARHQALGKKWRDNNKEKCSALSRASYERHKDVKLSRNRDHYHAVKHTVENLVKQLFNSAKTRARIDKMDFDLTKDWVRERLEAGVCEVSGLPFVCGKGRNCYSPSLDRIDNSKGYTLRNTRVILWGVNSLKGIGTDWDMRLIAGAIVAREVPN